MAEREFKKAIRINSEKPQITQANIKTITGNAAKYSLISIPFYLTVENRSFYFIILYQVQPAGGPKLYCREQKCL
jgi:hypothetical protein